MQTMTDELEQFNGLFEQAKKELVDKVAEKRVIIKKIADGLEQAGYPKHRICSAIVRKLAIINISTGKKYVYSDYIQRNLDASYKDYVHGKKGDKKKRVRKPLVAPHSDTGVEHGKMDVKINEKKKQSPTNTPTLVPINEKRKKVLDASVKKMLEVGKEHGYDFDNTDVEVIESETTETIIDAPPTPIESTKVKQMQQENNDLQGQLQIALAKIDELSQKHNSEHAQLAYLKNNYGELLDEYNRVSKPYMERMWIIMKVPVPGSDEPLVGVAEIDTVAKPVERRIQIPDDIPNKRTFKRYVKMEDKEQREADWNKLTNGRYSLDANIIPKTKPKTQ